MARDAAATRQRILDAAIAEFSARGIAGARVDRIAAASESNKSLIYRYFGDKERLFDAVFDEIVVRTMNDVPINADDLPGYAGRLWDWYLSHPEFLRLADWDELERHGAGMSGTGPQIARAEKIQAIADGQRRGVVNSALPAATILQLLLAICRSNPATEAGQSHREAVSAAVRQIVCPGDASNAINPR